MEPLKIHIPSNTESEAKYVFSILLEDILACKIEFETSNSPHYSIIQGNKRIEIKNSFFKENTFDKLYSKSNIPPLTSTHNLIIDGHNFVYELLYGKPEVNLTKSDTVIHLDIVGGSFFMLTRWEESVIDKTDHLGRFNAATALSVKQGFYRRPIVNEYAEILAGIFRYMDFQIPERSYYYEPVVTFDIDQIRKWFSFKELLISIKDNFKASKILYCFSDIVSYIRSRNKADKDPYYNFNYIINSLKEHEIKNVTFYFKPLRSKSKYDRNKYRLDSKEIQEAFHVIKAYSFKIGTHPGFSTYDDPNLISEGVNALSSHARQKLKSVRQHYLRFKIPDTWRHQSSNELTEDSSMIYPHEAGFRNGICQPFQVYDFQKRSLLNITERPLIFMETPYLSKRHKLLEDLTRTTNQVKKYGGANTILWHNSNLEYPRDRVLFNKALKIIS